MPNVDEEELKKIRFLDARLKNNKEMENEKQRIDFVEGRDGPEAAKKFAEQILALYKNAAIAESKYSNSIKYLTKYLGLKE